MKKKRIKLTIIFQEDEDDDDESPQDVYEGYFRIFTEEGVPFGDILYLQVIADE